MANNVAYGGEVTNAIGEVTLAGRVTRGPIAALAEVDGLVLTANYAADSVSLLAPHTLHPVREVAEVYEPFAIAISGQRAYISSVEPAYDTIAVLERGAVTARIPVADAIRDLAVSPDGRSVYAAVAADSGAALAVLNTETYELNTISLAAGELSMPTAVAVAPNGVVYVGVVHDNGGLLIAVDRGRIRGALPIPSMIRDLAVTRDGAAIFVASDDDDFGGIVDVIGAASLQIARTIELGAVATGISMSTDGERAYVLNGDRVTVLCTATLQIADHIDVGTTPATATESADGRLLIADNDGRVSAFPVNWTSNRALAQILDADVIAAQMRELESALEPA